MTSRKKLLLFLLLAVAAIAAVLVLTGRGVEAEAFRVEQAFYEEKILASGSVTLTDVADLTAPFQEEITAILTEEGDTVKAGEPLVELDTTDIDLRLSELAAGKSVLEARLLEMDRRLYPNALEQLAKARVEEAEALKDFENARRLFEAGAISQTQYDGAASRYALSTSSRRIAQSDAEALSATGALRLQIKAELQRQEAQMGSLEAERSRHIIKAPADGIVLDLFVSEGERSDPSRPLLTLAGNQDTLVEIALDERYVASVEKGQRVLVSADAYAAEKLEAVLETVAPSVDSETGTVALSVRLKDNRPYLIKNLTVRCEIVTGVYEDAVAVPERFLRKDEAGDFVYVLEQGKAQRRGVVRAPGNTSRIRILEGLSQGDLLLTSEALEAGDSVRLPGDDRP